MKNNNIILIGMPGCGKSTVGVVAAKILGYSFLDCDLYIQNKYSKLLWELIEELGCEKFISLEESALCRIECESHIIATGGSAVYGERAMKHLKTLGKVIYLSLSLDGVKEHIGNTGTSRGVVYRDGADLPTLYRERVPLYEKYADYTVDCNGKSVMHIARRIAELAGISV
ncbi:MAG: shikimate kinase [Clostridia bacterium]|nr:shikimate kinase [Clostridia bacterium]